MLEGLSIALILAVCLGFAARSIYRTWSGKGGCAGCPGCGKGDTSNPDDNVTLRR